MASAPTPWWHCLTDALRTSTTVPHETFPVHQAATHAATTPDERATYVRGVERQLDKARWHRTALQVAMIVVAGAAVLLQLKLKGGT